MSLVTHPENDSFENPDHLRLHKDVAWVVRSLWVLIVVGFFAGVWATSLANDVAANAKALEDKATTAQLASVADALTRIENNLKEADKRQREILDSQARLEQKVSDLEKKVDED